MGHADPRPNLDSFRADLVVLPAILGVAVSDLCGAKVSRLAIYGAGGLGRELVTAARNDPREIVFVSDEPRGPVMGIDVIPPGALLPGDEVIIGIGSGSVRRRLAGLGYRFGSLFAPTVIIGRDVEIGEGAVFCDHSLVSTSARIGRHFQCNYYAYVAHDCVVGDFVTFAPGVHCMGNVHIGDDAYVGAGALLKNGCADKPLRIGAGAVVGCGAVVTKDVLPGVTVVGNPAKPIVRAAAIAA